MPRTTEELLNDAKEAIETGELDYTIYLGGTKYVNGQKLVERLLSALDEQSAKLHEREWQDIDHGKPEKYQDPALWGIWVHNNKTDVRFFETHLLYLNKDGGLRCPNIYDDHHSEWDFDSYTHWKPLTTPPKKDVTQQSLTKDEG